MLDRLEANRLVEATRWVVVVHAEAQRRMPLSNAGLDEPDEEPSSDPLVTTRRDDSDRQLGDVLSNEAIAMVHLGVGPKPSRAQRSALFGNQSVVALPRPPNEVHRVPRIGHHLASGRRRLVRSPDRRLAEHRRQEGEVLGPSRTTPHPAHLDQSSSPTQVARCEARARDRRPRPLAQSPCGTFGPGRSRAICGAQRRKDRPRTQNAGPQRPSGASGWVSTSPPRRRLQLELSAGAPTTRP